MPQNRDDRETAIRIAQEYSGDETLSDAVPDPMLPNVWAVRHIRRLGFIVNTATEDVEEVEFKSWPPRATF